MAALAAILTVFAAAAGGTLAGRATVALDARLSGVTATVATSTALVGAAGVALVALALANAGGGLELLAAIALSLAAFGAAFLRGAVRIVAAEERRERTALAVLVRRRDASRRRPAA